MEGGSGGHRRFLALVKISNWPLNGPWAVVRGGTGSQFQKKQAEDLAPRRWGDHKMAGKKFSRSLHHPRGRNECRKAAIRTEEEAGSSECRRGLRNSRGSADRLRRMGRDSHARVSSNPSLKSGPSGQHVIKNSRR